jgi:hypothetical protein
MTLARLLVLAMSLPAARAVAQSDPVAESRAHYQAVDAYSDFAGLRNETAYAELTRRLEENRAPIVASEAAFELWQQGLLIEGIAHDRREDVFYVGSVRQAKIFRVTLPVLNRLSAGGDSLERFVASPLLLSAQGLGFTPDERTL